MGKNKKPMLTVLVEEEKLQRFRDYALSEGLSMGAVINQLIDHLLSGKPNVASISFDSPIEEKSDIYRGIDDKSIEIMISNAIESHRESIEKLIITSIDNQSESIEVMISNSIDNYGKSIDEFVITPLENHIKGLPPALSLQDIDRLIGSAILSATKTDNEIIAELKRAIGYQGAEIDRLSKFIENLSPIPPTIDDSKDLKTSQTNDSLSWDGFCELVGEPLPAQLNKASGDKMTTLASSKGFGDWKYNGNSKKFSLVLIV